MTSSESYNTNERTDHTEVDRSSQLYPGQTVVEPSHAPESSASKVRFTSVGNRGERTQCAGGGTPPLENNAKQIRKPLQSTDEKTAQRKVKRGHEARSVRWSTRAALWGVSELKRVRLCGRYSHRPMGTVDVLYSKVGDAGRAGYSGLQSCGSVWACPVCSARIQAERRVELHRLVEWAQSKEYTVVFGTVTLRHRVGQSLAELWTAVSKGYTSVHNSAKVTRLRKELGVVGYVRALEVTHGGNGWHPHLHLLWIFENGPETPVIDAPPGAVFEMDSGERTRLMDESVKRSEDDYQKRLDELADAEFNIWRRQAMKRGLGEPLRKNYQLKLVTQVSDVLSDYFVKATFDPTKKAATSMSFEMSGNTTKQGRGKVSRTPWQILHDLTTLGNVEDMDLWAEYELASKGRTALLWSNGLKALLGVEEKSDEKIAEEELGSVEDILFSLAEWSAARHHGAEILNAVEKGGKAAALAYVVQQGLDWLEADDPEVELDRQLYAERFGLSDDD